jgi:hypothetical protein
MTWPLARVYVETWRRLTGPDLPFICHTALFGPLPFTRGQTKSPRFRGLQMERMMGLEPTTFRMAKARGRSRQCPWLGAVLRAA